MSRPVPATMSTQHPDNASPPPWASSEVLAGDDEVYETFYVFSELGCEEQMWDWEGKDVDPFVVRKLFERFPEFFRSRVLGVDLRLTYRIPNPWVETSERKVFSEALETIPRAYDEALQFYGPGAKPPVFEVILPLTRSSREVVLTHSYYARIVSGKDEVPLEPPGFRVCDIVGEILPKKVEVIPLVEDADSMLRVSEIVRGVIRALRPRYLRLFLARSDPALNYGLIPAVTLVKVSASTALRVAEEEGVPLYTIIGTGSPPFRGNLRPGNLDAFLAEYGCFNTVTIQSSFKYDNPLDEVKAAVYRLNRELGSGELGVPNAEAALRAAEKVRRAYRSRVEKLANLVNFVAGLVPGRRARRLHVGLFGYSRSVGGVRLPRAIRFTAAMYTLGIPPELLGLEALSELSEEEWSALRDVYVNMMRDLGQAAAYVCWDNVNELLGDPLVYEALTKRFGAREGLAEVMRDLDYAESTLGIRVGGSSLRERRHHNTVNSALLCMAEGSREAVSYIVEAARLRGFLG